MQRRPERVRARDERDDARVGFQRCEENTVLRVVRVRGGFKSHWDLGRGVCGGERGEVEEELGEGVCGGWLVGDVRTGEVHLDEEVVACLAGEVGDG